MDKRMIGRTGLLTGALGFGSMELSGLEFSEADRLLNEALDLGINFIDSSPCYGVAEEYVGKAVGHRREEYILATKCGCNVDEQGRFTLGPDHIWSAEQLYRNIDRSLKLLRTDYIDIWQLHGIMPDYLEGGPGGEVMEAFEKIKESGKVRHLAFSCRNGTPDQPLYPAMFGYQACRELIPWNKFEVIQLIYGAMTRTNEEVIEEAKRRGIGVVCRGAMKKYFDTYDRLFEEAGLAELFEEGEGKADFLLRFALTHQGISTVIVGTKNIHHLRDNIRAAERGKLSEKVYEEAKRRLAGVGIAGQKLW